MVIFHSYVSLPEGSHKGEGFFIDDTLISAWGLCARLLNFSGRLTEFFVESTAQPWYFFMGNMMIIGFKISSRAADENVRSTFSAAMIGRGGHLLCSHVQRFVTFWLPGIVGEIETAQHGPSNGDMARSPQGFEDFNETLETEVPTSNNHFYTTVQRIPAVKNSAADIWSIGYYWILTHVRDHFSKMHLNRDLFILKIWRYFDSFRVSAHSTRRRVTRTSAAHQRHVGPCYVSQAGRVPAWRCHMILSYFVQESKETLGGYSTSILKSFFR